MSAPHFVSTGWMIRTTTVLILLVGTVMSPLCFAETAKGAVSQTQTAAATASAVASSVESKTGRIMRALFTTAIVDREPVDTLKTLSTDINRVFFFTDLRGLGGQIVTHRWEYNGQIMAEITFRVGVGARWRVYSSKNLLPEWTGIWTVAVNSESGETLHTSTFEYVAATPVIVE